MPNQDIIKEYVENNPKKLGGDSDCFTYQEVLAIAKNILNVSGPGKEYASLKFLQKYCDIYGGKNTADFTEFQHGDPRNYGGLLNVKNNWIFSHSGRGVAVAKGDHTNNKQHRYEEDCNSMALISNIRTAIKKQRLKTEMTMEFQLRFPASHLCKIAARYSYQIAEDELMGIKKVVIERKYLTKQDLRNIAYWKAPRSSGHAEKNDDAYVKEMTNFALKATTERARIEILTKLDGVSWPTASVILHLFHPDPYPILDFRALWSVSALVPKQYSFDYWWPYVQYCREVASRNSIDMRTLDRALWQYSKENQNDT